MLIMLKLTPFKVAFFLLFLKITMFKKDKANGFITSLLFCLMRLFLFMLIDKLWSGIKSNSEKGMNWVQKKLDIVEKKSVDDNEINQVVSSITRYFQVFLLSRSNLSKISLLEDIYFEINFCLVEENKKVNVSKNSFALKMAIVNLPNLFDFVINFRVLMDFISETGQEFIAPEFLNDIEIILDSLLK